MDQYSVNSGSYLIVCILQYSDHLAQYKALFHATFPMESVPLEIDSYNVHEITELVVVLQFVDQIPKCSIGN